MPKAQISKTDQSSMALRRAKQLAGSSAETIAMIQCENFTGMHFA